MSAKNPNGELPPSTTAGEYVQLDVETFLNAYTTLLGVIAGKLPCAEGFATGLGAVVEGLPPVALEDTPFNRGLYTGARLFPDAAQRLSFVWRAVVVMGIARDRKYGNYRNVTAGTMHIALATAIAMVQGSERTTEDELRASFDRMFRSLLNADRQ